ncbi:MAG: ArnT family glycosyltransferase, partial [Armatimonadota bacterium]
MRGNILPVRIQVDRVANFLLVGLLLIGFICLLNYYGHTLLPFWPDEAFFLQPAQNLAEGKGMGTPALDDLLPKISERTYWQPPVYFLVLAMWGKVMGFDIMSSRWMSRICGVGVLLLSWFLMRQWGISQWIALLCLIWTALDLTFQYNANIGRMDMLNALFLIACLLSFTAYQRDS